MPSKRNSIKSIFNFIPTNAANFNGKYSGFIKLKWLGIQCDQRTYNDVNCFEIGLRTEAGSHRSKESSITWSQRKHDKCRHKLKNRSTQIICPQRIVTQISRPGPLGRMFTCIMTGFCAGLYHRVFVC